MSKPFIIIPAHNRRELTLGCLRALQSHGILDSMAVTVIDDGSTDGTAGAVAGEFPSVVVLSGDGNLFWTGAVALGMTHAMKHGATSMVWLNDDAQPDAGSIELLVEEAERIQGVASAQGFVQTGPDTRWYFPFVYWSPKGLVAKDVPAPQSRTAVDACRGNLVAISRSVVDRVGYPDGRNIPHYNGDTDYTLRATRAGFPCAVLGDALLEEKDTIRTNNVSWLLSEVPLANIWSRIFRKSGNFYPRMHWVYHARHWGIRVFLEFPKPYLRLIIISVARLLIPRRILLALYAHRSHAWQAYAWTRTKS